MRTILCIIIGALVLSALQDKRVDGMSMHVSHFEHLTYDTKGLKQQHDRAKRSVTDRHKPVKLKFQAFGRNFDVHLHQDKTIFHPDLIIENGNGDQVDVNITHIYHGSLYGKKGSFVHGSIISGIFRGVIHDPDRGKYYLEEIHQFLRGSRGHSHMAGYRGHSVIYPEDAVSHPSLSSNHTHCGASKPEILARMKRFQKSSLHESDNPSNVVLSRRRRALDPVKKTCLLYVQTDHIFWDEFKSREVIISKIAEHVKAVNKIYTDTTFLTLSGEKIQGINFMVKRLRINESAPQSDDPFKSPNIGVEKFLDIASMANHNDYCLAYVFTNRDFDNGVLGLAWVGSAGGTSGGICEKFKVYSDGSAKSLNTGIVTFKNYGSIMPAKVTHITFAHEIGHNFGSPHDSGVTCTPGESRSIIQKSEGNYIMFARATSGNDPNNDVFSPCSIGNMSKVLEVKKDLCFVASNQPICGNQIVDADEDCDCGFGDDCKKAGDVCCTPGDDPDRTQRCKLKAGKQCSISQGICCDMKTCSFIREMTMCANATDCLGARYCSGVNATCPEGKQIRSGADVTECDQGTKTCVNGECTGSICRKYPDLETCSCTVPAGSKDRSTLCHVCCQKKGNASSCRSIADPLLSTQFNLSEIHQLPGSPCDGYNGYCDIFFKCRLVDADGPLSRLKKAIFNPALYSTIKNWIVEYWWAVLLMSLAVILVMAGFIKLCSVHTPSSNPKLPKHKQLPGADTLRRRRQRHQRVQQQQQGRHRSSRQHVEMDRYR